MADDLSKIGKADDTVVAFDRGLGFGVGGAASSSSLIRTIQREFDPGRQACAL